MKSNQRIDILLYSYLDFLRQLNSLAVDEKLYDTCVCHYLVDVYKNLLLAVHYVQYSSCNLQKDLSEIIVVECCRLRKLIDDQVSQDVGYPFRSNIFDG